VFTAVANAVRLLSTQKGARRNELFRSQSLDLGLICRDMPSFRSDLHRRNLNLVSSVLSLKDPEIEIRFQASNGVAIITTINEWGIRA
jgi:hypothetical protein